MKADLKDWKYISYFFSQYKFRSFFVIILMLISGLVEIANLSVLYPIINYGLNLENNNQVLRNFERITQYIPANNSFLAACIVLIVISFLTVVLKFFYYVFSNKLMLRIVGDVQKKILSQYIVADYDFYVKNQQGNLLYAATMAPQRTTAAVFAVIMLLYNSINAILLFCLLVSLTWKGTLLVFVIGLFYAAFIKNLLERYVKKCARIVVGQNEKKNVIFNELITGIKTIKVFQAFQEWKIRHTQAVDVGLANQFCVRISKVSPEMLVKFLFFMLIAFVGIFLSQRPQKDMMLLLPLFGTYAIAINRFLPYAHKLGTGFMTVSEFLPDARIIYDICNKPFDGSLDGTKKLQKFDNNILFENVTFKYQCMEGALLKSISFSIDKRKMTAIVGPSGSGKTTIINLLLKLYRPLEGDIKIDGVSIFDYSNESYLSQVGYVSQETFIFNASFKDNIRFGMHNCSEQRIEEAAQLANAHDFIMETPNGYETIVGDAGVKISGGQRQRIAIARAMLRKPSIIVLDEATSSLDNLSEKRIQEAINKISKQTTVLVIAHRLSTVQNADKIIIMEKGEIKEQGTHQELMNNKDVYFRLQESKSVKTHEMKRQEI